MSSFVVFNLYGQLPASVYDCLFYDCLMTMRLPAGCMACFFYMDLCSGAIHEV